MCGELRRLTVGAFTVDRAGIAGADRRDSRAGPGPLDPREALPHLPVRELTARRLACCTAGRSCRRARTARAAGARTAAGRRWPPRTARLRSLAVFGGDRGRAGRGRAGRRGVALGSFDGVHLGHRRVIERAMAAAAGRRHALQRGHVRAASDRRCCVPSWRPAELSTPQRRLELVAELGAGRADRDPLRPRVLADRARGVRERGARPARWGPATGGLGRNFRYGHRAQGIDRDAGGVRRSGSASRSSRHRCWRWTARRCRRRGSAT